MATSTSMQTAEEQVKANRRADPEWVVFDIDQSVSYDAATGVHYILAETLN